MQLVYKINVACMPEVHLTKLLQLLRTCFVEAYVMDTHELRCFDSAIVAQQNGNFIGVLFMRKKDAGKFSLHHFCVHPRFRQHGIGTQLVESCQIEASNGDVVFCELGDSVRKESVENILLKLGFKQNKERQHDESEIKSTFAWCKDA